MSSRSDSDLTARSRFEPGQYLRYFLDHPDPDERGTSRYFTIASGPSEGFIMLTTRLSEPGSSFKRALRRLPDGAVIATDRALRAVRLSAARAAGRVHRRGHRHHALSVHAR